MTFNIISDGDPGLASPVMQNFRHVNYGNALLPVNSTGSSVNNTIDLGSAAYGWKDFYMIGDIAVNTNKFTVAGSSGNTVIAGTLNVTGNATFDTSTLFVDAANNLVSVGLVNPSSIGSPKFSVQSRAVTSYALLTRSASGTNNLGGIYEGVAEEGNLYLLASGSINVVLNPNGDSYFTGGKLGVGIATPSDKFHLYDSGANVDLQIQTAGSNSYPRIVMKNDARQYNIILNGTDSDKLQIYDETALEYRLTLDSAGNLGLGTTSVDEKLHIEHTASVAMKIESTGASGDAAIFLRAKNATPGNTYIAFGDLASGGPGQILYSHPTNYMSFITNGSEAVRIDSNGYVGVGGTPDTKFHVQDSTNGIIKIESTGSNSQAQLQLQNDARQWVVKENGSDEFVIRDSTAAADRMRIDTSGNIIVDDGTILFGTSTAYGSGDLVIYDGQPDIFFYTSTGSTDEKAWDINFLAGTMTFRTWNDAVNSGQNFIKAERNGNSVKYVSFPTSPVGIGISTEPTANGSKVLFFGDNTADPTMATNTAGIYGKDVSGTVEMFAVDEAGNATQLSSHNPETGEWRFYSKNTKTGRIVEVNLEKFFKHYDQVNGTSFFTESCEI